MKIKIFIPQRLGENEMKELINEFGMDGEIIQYTDQTGGTDWIVQYLNPASIFVTGLTTVLLVSFVKSFGSKLGENLAEGISDETAKLFNLFKDGIGNILKGTAQIKRKELPNLIFDLNKVTYVFDFGQVNTNDYEEAIDALPNKLEHVITNLNTCETPIINDEHIGIVCIWHVAKKEWLVLSINAIDTYYEFSMVIWA